MKDSNEYLKHILIEIDYLMSDILTHSYTNFEKNETLKRAAVRSLEIIGEAVKNITDKTKEKLPDIDWKNMARMRDRLIHHYFGVDYNLVWDVIKNEIPLLKNQINNFFKEN